MTATDDRLATTERLHTIPARIALTPPGQAAGRLDGAWWPYSRDLALELPSLARAMDDMGMITRATVNPTLWQSVPRRVPVSGRLVKVGWFTDEQDLHEIMLLSHRAGRWELLVVPPETAADTAQRMMAAAATAGDMRTATALVHAMSTPGQARTTDLQGADDPSETDWEAEGGHLRATRDGAFPIAAAVG
ncbi:DUF5994 family protein [Yinghuangia soli]|uniref:DUF5994 family protein n=1 Tax=Yinghuangia soli TaxID=2908204 RepID=A0AA41Q0D3_9ACTN|nr:DUF5994 family protein [Yinghuangia soli]MCF2529249.1 DUF5994 family protein [Yinghuangia soli]